MTPLKTTAWEATILLDSREIWNELSTKAQVFLFIVVHGSCFISLDTVELTLTISSHAKLRTAIERTIYESTNTTKTSLPQMKIRKFPPKKL